MNGCGTADADALVRSILSVAECQAAALGREGWQGLSHSALFATLLTGLLTLAVAREGYRLLAGRGLVDPAQAVALLLRFGVVIALTTNWSAYDRLVYAVATDGPAEIAAIILPAAGVQAGQLSARLANAYDAIVTDPMPGDAPATPIVRGDPAGGANAETTPPAPRDALPGSDRRTGAGILLVTGAGPWIAARLALALLLAIGPLAFVALLFPVSAGLFVGWLRALVGTALIGLVVPMSLALELQMIDGPVTAAMREALPTVPGLAPIVWIFALVNLALVLVVQRMAGGLALPRRRPDGAAAPVASTGRERDRASPLPPPPAATAAIAAAPSVAALVAPPRAHAIVRAMQARTRSTAGIAVSSGGTPAPAPPPARAVRLAEAPRAATPRRAVTGKRLELGS